MSLNIQIHVWDLKQEHHCTGEVLAGFGMFAYKMTFRVLLVARTALARPLVLDAICN